VTASKSTVDREKDPSSSSDDADSDSSQLEFSDDGGESDSSDSDLYRALSLRDINRLHGRVSACIGKQFFDAADEIEGVVTSIVREVSTRELCFKYYDPKNSEFDFDYIYVSSIIDDASIVWSDAARPILDSCVLPLVVTKTAKPSWEYVTGAGTNIFEVEVLPPGSKRIKR